MCADLRQLCPKKVPYWIVHNFVLCHFPKRGQYKVYNTLSVSSAFLKCSLTLKLLTVNTVKSFSFVGVKFLEKTASSCPPELVDYKLSAYKH